ncbi:MAG: RNA 2',3'-cyclic phosphodiesterase [Actinomycetota bacterium]
MARDRASRPEAKPLRLFVAVEVPEEIRAAVNEAADPLRERFSKAKWVPLGNQHVTVKFLGKTWPRLLGWVKEAVEQAAVRSEPFETTSSALGTFPGGERARVLWAGLGDPGGRFSALASALDEALAREFKPEEREFMPHLTLARFDPPQALGDLPEVSSEPFTVDRLMLYRSHLRRPAPVYEPLHELRLGS